MATIDFIDKRDCGYCLHRKVCQYQFDKKETLSKLEGHLDNITVEAGAGFFVTFDCSHFYYDDNAIAKG